MRFLQERQADPINTPYNLAKKGLYHSRAEFEREQAKAEAYNKSNGLTSMPLKSWDTPMLVTEKPHDLTGSYYKPAFNELTIGKNQIGPNEEILRHEAIHGALNGKNDLGAQWAQDYKMLPNFSDYIFKSPQDMLSLSHDLNLPMGDHTKELRAYLSDLQAKRFNETGSRLENEKEAHDYFVDPAEPVPVNVEHFSTKPRELLQDVKKEGFNRTYQYFLNWLSKVTPGMVSNTPEFSPFS